MEKIISNLRALNIPNSYIVGGWVRDFIMKKESSDVDIASPMTPSELILFCQTNKINYFQTGIEHGTITLFVDGIGYVEHTTFRKDVTTDGRRATVAFASSLEEDVMRRDFTINGLAIDIQTGCIVDYVNGHSDIRDGVIRAIGKPTERFSEDYLRIVRAERFASTMEFTIHEDTRLAIDEMKFDVLHNVSTERIFEEVQKFLKKETQLESFQKFMFFVCEICHLDTTRYSFDTKFESMDEFVHYVFQPVDEKKRNMFPFSVEQKKRLSFDITISDDTSIADHVWKHKQLLLHLNEPNFRFYYNSAFLPCVVKLFEFVSLGKMKDYPPDLVGKEIGDYLKTKFKNT